MLSKHDNDLICRVGPDTPMGKAMRRFWVPVAMSSEVRRNGAPFDAEVLGEHFVVFRTDDGTVGVLDELCPHRGASLVLGRVENCGVRCIYHGWLFGTDGTLLETPNVQGDSFKKRVRHKAYPTHEAGGLIWAYLGADPSPPAFPDWPFNHVPPENIRTRYYAQECNYAQIQEGTVDSSHLGMLHASSLETVVKFARDHMPKPGESGHLPGRDETEHILTDFAPSFAATTTAYGFRYAALRKVQKNGVPCTVARIAAWVAPFTSLNASSDLAQIAVPMSDEATIVYLVSWWDSTPLPEGYDEAFGQDAATLSRYHLTREGIKDPNRPSRKNRWMQDRELIKNGNFAGFKGLIAEDAAVQNSSGSIRDRTNEHLCASDVAVARLYSQLIAVAKTPPDKPVMGAGANLRNQAFQVNISEQQEWFDAQPEGMSPIHSSGGAPSSSVRQG